MRARPFHTGLFVVMLATGALASTAWAATPTPAAGPPPDVMCAIGRGERGAHVEFQRGRLQKESVEQLDAVRHALAAMPRHGLGATPTPKVIVVYAHGGLVEACDAYDEINPPRRADPTSGDVRVPLAAVFRAAGAFPIFPIYHVGKAESYFGGVYDGRLATAVEDPRALSVVTRARLMAREKKIRGQNNRLHIDEHTTGTEESFRYAAFINGGLYSGGRMWSYMKWVIDQSMHLDSAAADPLPDDQVGENAPAGVAIARVLHDYLAAERSAGRETPRIMLVGHSTGAIFLTKFIRAWDVLDCNDPTQFEVVFMAPAIRYDDFLALDKPTLSPGRRAFATPMDRISKLRIFTMTDEAERKATTNDITDIVHFVTKKPRNPAIGRTFGRAVYAPSLLYAISGILEDHPDTPILGLARFHDQNNIIDYPEHLELSPFLDKPITEYPERVRHDAQNVKAVTAILNKFPASFVETPTADDAPLGQWSQASGHLQFPGDCATQASLQELIKNKDWASTQHHTRLPSATAAACAIGSCCETGG